MPLMEVLMDSLSRYRLDELVPVEEFRTMWPMSISTERRRRKVEKGWPPTVRVNRRVFYLRSGLADFLARQVELSGSGSDPEPSAGLAAPDPKSDGERAARAPALTVDQVVAWLRGVVAGASGGAVGPGDSGDRHNGVGGQRDGGH